MLYYPEQATQSRMGSKRKRQYSSSQYVNTPNMKYKFKLS